MAEQQQQLATGSGTDMTAAAADASVNVSELGKALDQATISSSASAAASPADSRYNSTGVDDDDEPDEGDEEDDYEEDDDENDANDFGDDSGFDGADGDFGMADTTNDNDDDNDDDDDDGDDIATSPIKLESIANAAPLKSKSPKKRGRTDSLKKMLPAPASQRHKQKDDGSGAAGASPSAGASASAASASSEFNNSSSSIVIGGCEIDAFGAPKATPAKLLVKDRTGAGMGVPRPHLISNAVKQAPPAKEKSNPRRWSKHEDESLRLAVERSGERNWKAIADQVPGRNHTQCLQRWTKVLKPGLIKGHWTPEEDSKLRELVTEEKKNWGQVASLIPGRTSKQCRERWCNHLDPNINKGSYTEDEDKIIIEMQSKLGNRWSIIAQQLKGRTEDAVKIRWKSLMRGRRAAMKDEKHHSAPAAAGALASVPSSAPSSSSLMADSTAPLLAEKAKARVTKVPPSRQKTRVASPVVKSEKTAPPSLPAAAAAAAAGPSGVDKAAMTASSHAAPLAPAMLELQPAELSLDGDDGVGKLDGLDLAAAIGVTDDLVAASLQGFQMNSRYQSSAALNGGVPLSGVYPPATASQTISPANHAMYTASNGYSVNAVAPPSAYAMQHAYSGMPPSATMPQSYAMAGSYGAPSQMAMGVQSAPMQYYSGVSSAMAPPNQGYSQAGYGAPRQMYQSYASGGGGGGVYPSSAGMPMAAQNFSGMPASMYGGGSFSGSAMAPPANSVGLSHAAASMHVGLPPSSAAAAAKMLNTPREEWGSSQTPRSQMILTEGHASAYDLFHQQRVRLMLQERDKSGLTLSSAPSPGQAMLTKELEANKERQKRQAIMQKGWKSAVEAMMASSDLSSLDDQQRFDGFLEKVTLSALDPTDDELISDIIADDSLDVETPVG